MGTGVDCGRRSGTDLAILQRGSGEEDLRNPTGPRSAGRGLWRGQRREILESEELVGRILGREGLHPPVQRLRGQWQEGRVRHLGATLVPRRGVKCIGANENAYKQ